VDALDLAVVLVPSSVIASFPPATIGVSRSAIRRRRDASGLRITAQLSV
jgi:hypothetical protein